MISCAETRSVFGVFAQVLSYLTASDLMLGMLINFNVPLLRQGIKRVVRTADP